MPIYSWKCKDCDYSFDTIQKVKDPIPKCEECESVNVVKILSTFGFILKGNCWAKDGYSKKNKK